MSQSFYVYNGPVIRLKMFRGIFAEHFTFPCEKRRIETPVDRLCSGRNGKQYKASENAECCNCRICGKPFHMLKIYFTVIMFGPVRNDRQTRCHNGSVAETAVKIIRVQNSASCQPRPAAVGGTSRNRQVRHPLLSKPEHFLYGLRGNFHGNTHSSR